MSAARDEEQRLRLIRIAQSANLPVRAVLHLARDELDTLGGFDDDVVRWYAAALLDSAEREAGRAPRGWTAACECRGCGPVLLWREAPALVLGCPWCLNRVAGLPVPDPHAVA